MAVETTTLLALPQTALARKSLELVVREESAAVANHSIRSFLFAKLLADHLQMKPGDDYNSELLFFSCVLHDLGLTRLADDNLRFEVDGANLAATFLTEHGVTADAVDDVWQAIALHTSPQIAEHRGTLCYLTVSGINIDLDAPSEFITDAQGAQIHAAYPRHSMVTTLMDTIIAQADAHPNKAPLLSAAAALAFERQQLPDHQTRPEHNTIANGRWGN